MLRLRNTKADSAQCDFFMRTEWCPRTTFHGLPPKLMFGGKLGRKSVASPWQCPPSDNVCSPETSRWFRRCQSESISIPQVLAPIRLRTSGSGPPGLPPAPVAGLLSEGGLSGGAEAALSGGLSTAAIGLPDIRYGQRDRDPAPGACPSRHDGRSAVGMAHVGGVGRGVPKRFHDLFRSSTTCAHLWKISPRRGAHWANNPYRAIRSSKPDTAANTAAANPFPD
jgi:hypothetical protein